MTTTVALCGAGWIAPVHAAAARSNGYELVAVASRSVERATQQAASLGCRAVGYDELPAHADVVVVATPPQCHAADVCRLLESGAAVLVEKPLCRTIAEADDIVDAARRHDGRLLYGENLAYSPVVQHLVALVPSLGPIGHLEVRALQGLPTWGSFTTDDWGGGALFDLGVHPLAVALLVAGAAGEGRPTHVRATLRGGPGHNSDEHAELRVGFRSGLVASVVASWQSGPEPMWDAQVASVNAVLRAELLPTPQLEHNGEAVPVPRAASPATAVEQLGYRSQMRALVDDVEQRREPTMSAAFGREVLQMVCAAYTSAGRDGDAVPLPFSGSRHLTPLQLWRGG